MSYVNDVAAHFSSYFTADQVTRAAGWSMIVNLSAQYLQRFEPMERPKHRSHAGSRNKFWAADTCYDVHPLALWILCAAFHHARGSGRSLYYYRQNNAIASTGGYWTGTPLDRALMQARRCMADTREKELIALRRGSWSWGFDFARFCPHLPPHDGWTGKSGAML